MAEAKAYVLKHFDTPLLRFAADRNAQDPHYEINWVNEAEKRLLPLGLEATPPEQHARALVRHRRKGCPCVSVLSYANDATTHGAQCAVQTTRRRTLHDADARRATSRTTQPKRKRPCRSRPLK